MQERERLESALAATRNDLSNYSSQLHEYVIQNRHTDTDGLDIFEYLQSLLDWTMI